MTKELSVFLNADHVGRLETDPSGEMSFSYLEGTDRAISVGMPIHQKRFGHKHCEAFFGGLLPEGEAARKALGRRFGVSIQNTFSLLKSIGAECAGALSILELGLTPNAEQAEHVQLLTESELAQHIRELPDRPLFIDVANLRISLAGVQDKAAVTVTSEGIGIPDKGPTTHILKPDLKQAPGAIHCEYLCMKTAAQLKLNVAEVKLAKAEDQTFLLVKRFDRERRGSESLVRIHQEDFCQAMAIPTYKKYQDEGGPSLHDCFAILSETSAPAKSRLKLLNAVIYNYLAGNMDAHGKNFSLLHTSNGIEVAPMYDVICTLAFPQFSKLLAMEIGEYSDPQEIYAHQWRVFSNEIKYSFPSFKRLAKRLYNDMPSAIKKEYEQMQRAGWGHTACERAIEVICFNCQMMSDRLS